MPAAFSGGLLNFAAAADGSSCYRGRSILSAVHMRFLLFFLVILMAAPSAAQQPAPILLRPARVFDGVDPRPHAGWTVLVRGDRIEAAGPNLAVPAGARVIELPNTTLMPGMIEGTRTSSSTLITRRAGTIRC